MPWSSPRSSGWRATDWIIDAKMLPIPTPAPRAPRPTPSARPIALPAFVTSPVVAARTVAITRLLLKSAAPAKPAQPLLVGIPSDASVLRLDRGADVDGGQGGEDERLDRDHDHDLEQVERRRHRHRHDGEDDALEDEHQPDEGEDQDVAREHVREQTDAQRDQAHELAQHLEGDDQREQGLRRLGDPAREVADRAIPADPLDMGEDERQERERLR